MRIEGSATYVATDDLTPAVNAALVLESPRHQWHIKSAIKAKQGPHVFERIALIARAGR